MATYCVDLTASANGDGSEGSPLNALPSNFSSAGYVDGDEFLFKAGTTHPFTWSGSSADALTVNRRITFGKYGTGEKPIIAANYTGTGVGRLFRFYNSACILEDITINGDGSVPFTAVYTQSAFADFTVRRVSFRNILGSNQNAIVVAPTSGLTGTLTIEDCDFDNIGNDAVIAWCTGTIYLRRNVVRNVSVDSANGDCLSVTGNCARLIVTDNDLDHSNKDTKQCFIQDGGTSGFAFIGFNRMNGYTGSDSTTHTALYLTLPGVIVGNAINSWRSGVFCGGANISVIGNLIRQGGGSTDTGAIWGASAGMKAYNNTIVRDLGGDELSNAAIRNNTDDASNDYRNNVIAGFTRGIRRGASATDSHNCFHDVTTPVVNAAQETQSPGTGSLTDDPLLDSSYRPRAGSPVIGAGTYLYNARHMGGKRMSQVSPDIGAYQYVETRSVALARAV